MRSNRPVDAAGTKYWFWPRNCDSQGVKPILNLPIVARPDEPPSPCETSRALAAPCLAPIRQDNAAAWAAAKAYARLQALPAPGKCHGLDLYL